MTGVVDRINKERDVSPEVSLKDAFYFCKEWEEGTQTHYLYCPKNIANQVQDALRGRSVEFAATAVKQVEVIRLHKDSITQGLLDQFSILESEEDRGNKLKEISQATESSLQI